MYPEYIMKALRDSGKPEEELLALPKSVVFQLVVCYYADGEIDKMQCLKDLFEEVM